MVFLYTIERHCYHSLNHSEHKRNEVPTMRIVRPDSVVYDMHYIVLCWLHIFKNKI